MLHNLLPASLIPPTLLTMGLALQPAITLSALAPQENLFGSPGMQLLLTGLLTAGVLYLTNWFTQRNLKMSIENVRLQAENAAAELKAQTGKVDKIAENTAATQVAQASIGARVDGQMSALQAVIEGLRSDLAAAKLAVVTEEDKAEALAMQAIKDKAESDAKLVAARQVSSTGGGGAGAGGHGGGLTATIPTVTVPVESASANDTPPAERKRIIEP